MSEDYTARLLTQQDIAQLVPDVLGLAQRALAPNPHAVYAALRDQNGLNDSSAGHTVAIACFAPSGALAGFWPVAMRRVLPGVRLLSAPCVPLFDVAGYPVLADGEERPAMAALLHQALIMKPALQLRNMLTEGPAWQALSDLAQAGHIKLTLLAQWERALLDKAAAPDAESYLAASMSGSTRKRLRAKRRALEEAGEPLELVMHHTPDALEEGFARYQQLEMSGWKGENGTALAQNPADAAYLRAVLTTLAQAGPPAGAMIADLRQGPRSLAVGLLLRAGGEVFFWKTTYDETLAKQSPGVLLDMMLTQWLYDQPWFAWLDTATDDSIDPNGLIWGERRAMANVMIEPPGGSLQGRMAVAASRLRKRIKAIRNQAK